MSNMGKLKVHRHNVIFYLGVAACGIECNEIIPRKRKEYMPYKSRILIKQS